MIETEFREIETEGTEFLTHGYSMQRHQDGHMRKIYLNYRDRGFNHREALQAARKKASTDLLEQFEGDLIDQR